MKKLICIILVLTMIASTINVSFAAEVEKGDIFSYGTSAVIDISKSILVSDNNGKLTQYEYASVIDDESCVTGKEQLMQPNAVSDTTNIMQTDILPYSSTDFTFNANLLTTFNTVTGPVSANGANEPKFSYNRFLKENISDYSGELTLNFEDLVLDGRNGLDLRIGRTYQSVAADIGKNSIMILPDENGILRNKLVNDYSTYFLDRYNLGVGWEFSFPSVQIETEYIPQEITNTYYYDKETELYYHSGNGDVYQVEFTTDTTDSNLKGYYNKDIKFNNDTGYSNGQVTSEYSLTLADKTKQYFAEDGRLIGIVDRFGNTIKFEHELICTTNRVHEGNFKYENNMWSTSTDSEGTYDAIQLDDDNTGSIDGCVMHFRRDNADETYIMSYPVQVEPSSQYQIGLRVKNPYASDIRVDILGYDTAYNQKESKTLWIKDYTADEWHNYIGTFSLSTAVRYVIIKISPEVAEGTYIDYVSLDKPKPLIKKITDSVGRTVDFVYQGDIAAGEKTGSVTLTVTSPNGESTRTLTYNKQIIEFGLGNTDDISKTRQKMLWYLGSSATEGADGAIVKYNYTGGMADEDAYPKLYYDYTSKTHSDSDVWVHKPVLSHISYKDREKRYEYETVRKHLGDDGYHDTLRIRKKYDRYGYTPGDGYVYFKGEIGAVNYSYGGTYNGNTFDNETGYPSYTFDDETTLNEQWTVTKSGKAIDTITFSNFAVVCQTSTAAGTTITSDYTNHPTFKNSPIEIKNTVTQNGESKITYALYSYNDWGGVATESKEVTENIKNDASLLEKYTTSYQYNTDYHFITQKSYYNDINSPQVHEINSFDSDGRLILSENAVKQKTYYYYDNITYPFLLTKTLQDDPMGLQNVLGGERVVTYTYDSYALYPLFVTEAYDKGTSQTQYVYDYITGDVIVEALPDGSYTEYAYYSDGRIKMIISPYSQYINGKQFYTAEAHSYGSYRICSDYDDVDNEEPVYDVEYIDCYYVLPNAESATLFGAQVNFYDAVGNLKMNEKYDFSKTDQNSYYLRYKTKYYHDNYDRLIKTVDNEGHTVNYTYDSFDRPASITDSESNVYTYTYDSVQNKVDLSLNGANSDDDKLLMTQYFDIYGNVIQNMVYPSNNDSHTMSESYEYDLNNNAVSYTNANGNKTEYVYDAENRLRETILANGVKATSSYSGFNKPTFEKVYDSDGTEKSSRISYTNEKGDLKMKFFIFDKLLVYANEYSSDSKGRVTSINEGENTKLIAYDESDNLISVTSGESSINRAYNWFGEVLSASTDGNTSTIQYGYDALGNIAAKSQNSEYDIGYTYSSIGNITQITMPSERTQSYTYTANGDLDTIVTDGNTFDYDYYDTGYVKSITYPEGLKTVYEYDNINRVTRLTTAKNGTTINTFEYEYDNNGNTTKEICNGAATTYFYDSLDRLISVTYSDGSSVAYEYDALNNRTKETYSNGDVKDYVYDEKYQLKEIKLNGEVTDTFTYNQTGAVVTHSNKTFTYDEWDRMSGYSDGTNTYTYKYDANGIRTQKNDKQYIIDINNNVVAETDSAGAITDEILWGHQPLARKTNGSWYYYIYNAHGDVAGLVNESGTVVNTYEYTPWGEIRSETEAVDNPVKYAGEYYDDELDMIYLRARYYNPQIGRFTSFDIKEGEISNPLDMNRYVYCRNNPIKYVDPSGESVLTISAGLAGLLKLLVAAVTAIGATYAVANIVNNIQDNRKHHILHGSNNSHESGWRKFNIDPNDPNGFEKLLPIINEVVRNGVKSDWTKQPTGVYTKEITYYFSKVGETVKVIVNKGLDGIERITDAFTIFK